MRASRSLCFHTVRSLPFFTRHLSVHHASVSPQAWQAAQSELILRCIAIGLCSHHALLHAGITGISSRRRSCPRRGSSRRRPRWARACRSWGPDSPSSCAACR